MHRSFTGPFASLILGAATSTAPSVSAQAPPAAPVPSAAPAPPTSMPPANAESEAMAPARLSAMLDAGDTAMVVQTFRRHPAAVLPFIDEFLEGGLAMIEKSADAAPDARREALAAAQDSFRRAVKFAELANQAFGEVIFTEYAAAFGSWSPLEQASFREGQAAYKSGRQAAKSSPEEAIPLYRRSLAIAESLGDHWGVAMNQLAIADACSGLNRASEGHGAAIRAIELFGRLQLKPSYVKSLKTCARLRQQLQMPDMGTGQLRMVLQAMGPSTPAAERQAVVDELVSLLERLGRKDEVETLKEMERIKGAGATPTPGPG